MTDHDDDITTSGWNRRTVLKGAAAGTMLWAVPSVTSLATRAAASAVNGSCSPAGHDGFPACQPGDMNFTQCGTEGALDFCFCDEDTEGNEHCYANVFCDDPQVTPCNTSADCSGDSTCVSSTGCGSICVPCCGDPVAPSAHSNGKRANAARR